VLRPFKDPFPSKGGDRFCLRKPRHEVERYEGLIDRLAPQTIFEVGVYQGGSTALLAQLARPRKLIAVELESKPVRGLEQFADQRGLGETLSLHWGVDQSDRPALRRICASELGSEALDLVIDDASHFLDESRATFDELFPRLRPGGEYVLEDWSWAHAAIDLWPGRAALTRLVFELVIVCAHHPEVIADVAVDRAWTVVRRGPAELDADAFDVSALLGARGSELIAGLGEGASPQRPRPPHRD
jgi:predicted O-methyltransferase YrrM